MSVVCDLYLAQWTGLLSEGGCSARSRQRRRRAEGARDRLEFESMHMIACTCARGFN